jgi:ABC-type transport system involved in cytochrome c biogenesis ATPase subunit
MLFSARRISKRYAAGAPGCSAVARVLVGIDLDLDQGAIVGVVGARGSGKTTLLRCVAGLARPDFGALHWAPAAHRPRVTALAPAALPFETVRDVLHRASADGLVAPDGFRDAMDHLGLAGLLARTQAALTTDERARLALAVAVAARHPLLLLDGTADALATAARPAVRACLERHAAAGGAVLVTGRDPAAVVALARTVYQLADGRLRPLAAPDAARTPARVAEGPPTRAVR